MEHPGTTSPSAEGALVRPALLYDGGVSTRYHVAVRRPDDDAVLVLRDGALPSFDVDEPPTWQVVGPVVDGMRERHGIDVVALRACWVTDGAEDRGAARRLYEVEMIDGHVPEGAGWAGPASITADDPALAAALAAGALAPADGDRQPWYRPGWFGGMVAWIDERLAEVGLRRRGPIRQSRSWGRSALLTLETDRGRLWAKQVPEVFAHEVAVTGLLEDCDPGLVPPVVAADPDRGRLLLEHVDGQLLAANGVEPAAWLATMARLAEIQRVLARDLGALRMAGAPAAPLDALALAVPALLADEDLLLVGRAGGLTRREHHALVARTDALVGACRALADASVGPSLDHGDLSASQVIVGEMGPVILDWSDATVTHPFIAAASFLMDPTDVPVGNGGPITGDLATAYLDGWSVGEAHRSSHLRRELELARTVHPLHMVWLYATRVLPGLEQRWEMERMVPWFVRAGILPP
jgi:hypothetical protein